MFLWEIIIKKVDVVRNEDEDKRKMKMRRRTLMRNYVLIRFFFITNKFVFLMNVKKKQMCAAKDLREVFTFNLVDTRLENLLLLI